MAARPKVESQPPKSFIDKVEQPKPCAIKKKKKPKKDNNLYDVEVTVVDKDKKCMKIHVGHGNEFDEWRDFKSTVISYHLSASKKLMFQTKKR